MATRSPLTTYIDSSPHYDRGRNGYEIVYIVPHHAAYKGASVANIGRVFHNCQTSAHYGVDGTDIGSYVSESDTAWACGNFKRNCQSISIEMSNSTGAPNWEVSDLTIETTIKLIADIAYRLGWSYIGYTGDMRGDIVLHRWIAQTACPGPYIVKNALDRYIATEADKLLKARRNGQKIVVVPQYVDKSGKLVVDGEFGFQSCIKMQKWLKSPYNDGCISGQLKSEREHILNLEWCVDYGKGGSYTVKLLQSKLGIRADGYIGVQTIKALQKFLNKQGFKLKVDGYAGSLTCKAFQTYLNKVV